MPKTMNVNDDPNIDVPNDWDKWPSVKTLKNVGKVCPRVWRDVYLYSNKNDFYGFLTKDKVLTAPLFAKHFLVISEDAGVVAITVAKADKKVTEWVLLDLKAGGKVLLDHFAAHFQFSYNLLAYRIDEKGYAWPANMKWGLINFRTGEIMMRPTFLESTEFGPNYIQVKDRILRHLAQNL